MAATSADVASAVPPSAISAAEDTLAAAESVGDHLSQLLAAAAADPDAVAELPPVLRARAFLAVAQAATSLFAGTIRAYPSRCLRLSFFSSVFLPSSNVSFCGFLQCG
jgi:exosome complex protein LRP1